MSQIIDKDRILIEKHLDFALTDEEKAHFNQRLEDQNFAAEVRLYEQSVKSVHAFGDARLKDVLMEEEAKLVSNPLPQYKATKVVSMSQCWAMAASVLVVLGASLWYFIGKSIPNKPSVEMVFEQNFKPYQNFDAPNIRDNATKTNREKAYALYENGDYAQALTYFEQITTPQYKDQFFEANAYLAMHQAEKAASLFEKLSQASDFDLQKHAEWYWALSLLQTQPIEAQRILDKIKKDRQHPFYKNAVQISF